MLKKEKKDEEGGKVCLKHKAFLKNVVYLDLISIKVTLYSHES